MFAVNGEEIRNSIETRSEIGIKFINEELNQTIGKGRNGMRFKAVRT